MNRRAFIKSLGLLALSASAPLALLREWRRSGIITGETFRLDSPLVLDLPPDFLIRNCNFIANEGFAGDCMVRFLSTPVRGTVESCYFNGRNLPVGSCALSFA